MARPAEKARSMLNKWVAMKESAEKDDERKRSRIGRRPHLASEVEHLADAERYRGQIIREISNLLSRIQNPAQSDNIIREMNDDINKLLREKFHYNKRIYELGGLDYNTIERQRRIEEGDEQINSMYRYFGAAKSLPGVKELLLQQQQSSMKGKKRKFTDIHQNITPEYFGWNDEEDGALLELENEALQTGLSMITSLSSHNTNESKEAQPTCEVPTSRRQVNIFRSKATSDDWNGYYQSHFGAGIDSVSDENEDDIAIVDDFFQSTPTQDDIGKIQLERKKKDFSDV